MYENGISLPVATIIFWPIKNLNFILSFRFFDLTVNSAIDNKKHIVKTGKRCLYNEVHILFSKTIGAF